MNKIKKHHNIIIIGSGLGGLVSGNLLAKKGHKVTIFESHSSLGGCTSGFYRKGFYFESGTLSFECSPSVFKVMEDIGVLEKIPFVKHEKRWVSQNLDSPADSYQDLKDILYSTFSSERKKLDRYFSQIDKMYQAVKPFFQKPIPTLYDSYDSSEFFMSILSLIPHEIGFPRMYKKYGDMSIEEFNAEFFEKDSKLYKLLTQIGYNNMGALVFGGMVPALLDDYWTVYGGMQLWADILAENFQKLGGELKLNSYVDKILTRDGVAVGIRSKETTFEADYVVSACDYKKTFLKLIDNKSLIPLDQQKKIKQAKVSVGMSTVYLGLNISSVKLKEYMKTAFVLFSNLDKKKNLDNCEDLDFLRENLLFVYSPSMMNPGLAPNGKSSLMIQAPTSAELLPTWKDKNKVEYKKFKEKIKEDLIKQVEFIIPNLRNLIEFDDAATPLTYERYTHNSDGATTAWSWDLKEKFFTNPISVNVKTPVNNLYIGSCWAVQFGGVPGAILAAHECSKLVDRQ